MKGFFVIGFFALAASMPAFSFGKGIGIGDRPELDFFDAAEGFPMEEETSSDEDFQPAPTTDHGDIQVPQISAEPKTSEHHPSCLILTVSDILDLHFSESNINAITLLLQHSLESCPGLNSTFNIFQKIMNHKSLNFTNALDFIKTFEVGTTEKENSEEEKAPEESHETGFRVPFALDIIKDKDSKIGHRFSLHDPMGLFAKKDNDEAHGHLESEADDDQDHEDDRRHSIHSAEVVEPQPLHPAPENRDHRGWKEIMDEAKNLYSLE